MTAAIEKGFRGVFMESGSNQARVAIRGDEFKRLMAYNDRKWLVVLDATFVALAGFGPLLMAVHIANMMSAFVETQDYLGSVKEGLTRLAPTVAAFLIVVIGSQWLTSIINGKCIAKIRIAMFANLVEQDTSYFDDISTGDIISRLSEDAAFAFDTYIDRFMTALRPIVQIVGSVVLAFVTSWRVALAVVGVIPLSVILYYGAEYIVNLYSARFRDTSSRSAEKAEEVMTSFRTVKSSDCELYESEEYAQSLLSIHDVVKSVSHITAANSGLLNLLSWGVLSPLIYYISWLLIKRPYISQRIGDIMILANSFSNIGVSVSMTITALDEFSAAADSAAKVLDVLEAKPSRSRTHGNSLEVSEGKIEFRDVCFKYPGSETYAADHLSFTVNPGETVALVGESGCGKSTALALLQQFYPLKSGKILIDDVDTSELSPTSVRSSMSIVSQMSVLFSMSILDNIRYARSDASEEDVRSAATIGNAHDFIMDIPHHYDALVAQTSLSGGQKQRICISRAILADAPILLLDEATASLDTENEQLVQESLERSRVGKTTIIVAHRLSTVRIANRIIVLQNGQVTESGTHEELLAYDKAYANLIKFQLE
jgi:ABC-type multidrug transport system fused ATPase/permease subunit